MTFQELGEDIRRKREALGLSIDDISARIKVSARVLHAIESGNETSLPHAVYTKSFVRAFGAVVGYDPEELAMRLEAIYPPETLDGPRSETATMVRVPVPGRGRHLALLACLLLLLAGVGAGGWYLFATYGATLHELVKKPFSSLSSVPVGTEQPLSGHEGIEPVPAETPVSLPAHEPLPPDEPAGQGLLQSAADAADASARDGAADAPAFVTEEDVSSVQATEEADVARAEAAAPAIQQLQITARANCWVGSRADDGPQRQYTVKAGESFTLTFTRTIEVSLGNPSGVDVRYNGEPYALTFLPRGNARFTLP